jgi:thymidylate kinase
MKKAANGSIVIFDRFPLEAIDPQIGEGQMDGAKISARVGNVNGMIARRLAKVEKAYYEKIRPPDHLVLLDVSPEVSLRRKPDHKQEVIEAKSQLIRGLTALAESDASGSRRIRLNADQPYENVIMQLKKRVWEIL